MKIRKINALITACIIAGSIGTSVYAQDKISLITQGSQVTVSLDNIEWAGKKISVFIYSTSDENGNPIDFSAVTNDVFLKAAVYADEFMADENGKADFSYLMRDDDISGNYCVSISLTDGTHEENAEYFYASSDERQEFVNEIKQAVISENINTLTEIFSREETDEKILESCGFLMEEYKNLSDDKKGIVLNRMIKLYSDDEVEAFNEALIVQILNDSQNPEAVFTKYSSYIGDYLFNNKNYTELKEEGKNSILSGVLATIDFESFADIEENVAIQAALTIVNVQESYASIFEKLEQNNDIFQLTMSDYNSLSDYYKSAVMKKMTSQNFKTVDELRNRFNTAVRDALSEQNKGSNGSSSSGGGGDGGGTSAIVQGDIINTMLGKDNQTPDVPEETVPDETVMFSDIDGVEWAREAIEKLCEANVITGTGDGKFEPDREVTREEFVKMLVNAMGFDVTDGNTGFADVENGAWYENYIKTAVDNGIVSGISENEFGVGEKITRQDMALMIFRALKLEENEDSEFADDADISDYAKTAVYAVKNAGIISGMGDNMFLPKAFATRAQAAQMIYLGTK